MRSPRYWPNHRRSCASIMPRRGAVTRAAAGISKSFTSPVFASMRPMWRWRKSVNQALFCESGMTS